MHERDAGHGQRFERLVRGEGLQAPLADPLLALALPFLQIGATAEDGPVAAHEDEPRLIGRRTRRCRKERFAHFEIERIAHFRPVERDGGDAVGERVGDRHIARLPRSSAMRSRE